MKNFGTNLLGIGQVAGRLVMGTFVTGIFGIAQMHFNEQYRNSGKHVIGEVERGVEHGMMKLKHLKHK